MGKGTGSDSRVLQWVLSGGVRGAEKDKGRKHGRSHGESFGTGGR